MTVRVYLLLALAGTAAAQNTPADSIRKQLEAARIQRESVRKQLEAAAAWHVAPPAAEAAEAAPECDPLPPAEITPIVDGAAQRYQLKPALLRGVIERESAGRPCAISGKGARGLMQLMPTTIDQFSVADPFDPRENVAAGAQFLKQLLDKYKGDLSLTLAAYNAGPAVVDQANGIPDIPETRDYVDSILKKLNSDKPAAPAPPRTQ